MLRKIGKIGKINQKANREIAKLWMSKGISSCENCGSTYILQNAHRHKRMWYRSQVELLWKLEQVLRLCNMCHSQIEYKREESEKMFLRIRGEE